MSECRSALPTYRCPCCGTPLLDDEPIPDPGPDFRQVVWAKKRPRPGFHFSPLQAKVISVLWDAFCSGRPVVSIRHIIDAIGTERNNPSITSIFRAGVQMNQAMHVMILNVGKGLWRLADPS
jgi:hypothetical protein